MPAKSPAQTLLEKAEKKASSSTGWFSSSSTKYEEAGDMFQSAANAFKLDKLFIEAGDAHSREAECREKSGEDNEAANAWWNASKAYKQGNNLELAIEALRQTINLLTKSGRFRQAADREKEIAMLHQKRGDLAKACESYEQSGDWYSQEDANAMANACYKEAADLHADLNEFGPAILRYEQVAENSLQSSLTKYSVKEYWLRSGLCALANSDAVTAKRNLDRYISTDPTFQTTREAKFLHTLIEAVESSDAPAFSSACLDYDQIMKLDNWKTGILLKIKTTLDEEPGLT